LKTGKYWPLKDAEGGGGAVIGGKGRAPHRETGKFSSRKTDPRRCQEGKKIEAMDTEQDRKKKCDFSKEGEEKERGIGRIKLPELRRETQVRKAKGVGPLARKARNNAAS